MWKSIGALVARAGETLGIEIPEIPDITAVGDTVEAAAAKPDRFVTDVTSTAADLAGRATDAAADVGDTSTATAEQAAGAAVALQDKIST